MRSGDETRTKAAFASLSEREPEEEGRAEEEKKQHCIAILTKCGMLRTVTKFWIYHHTTFSCLSVAMVVIVHIPYVRLESLLVK